MLVAAMLLPLAEVACGPVQSTAFLIDAEVQLEAARTAGAAKYSPFEWTSAKLYLHQARVETGYSNYDVALEYAHKASDYARKAKQEAISIQQGESGEAPSPDASDDASSSSDDSTSGSTDSGNATP